MTRRQLVVRGTALGAAIGVGGLLSACGGGSASGGAAGATGAGKPKRGGTLRIGLGDASNSKLADPQNFVTSLDIVMAPTLYSPMLKQDREGVYQLWLLDELEPNATSMQWTFRLKEGIEFHDGKTADADDLIFTARRAIQKKTLTGMQAWKWADPNGMRKLDARTVRFTLKQPWAVVRDSLIGPGSSLLPAGFDPDKPVGTGPFKLVSVNPGQGAQTVRFDNYFAGTVWLDGLNIVQFKDPAAQLNALLGGQIDGVESINTDQLPTIKGRGDITIISAGTVGGTTRQIAMNTQVKPFDNNDVRQAMRLLANRQQMIDQLYPGQAKPANDVWTASNSSTYNKDLPQREQDVEKAKSLLKRAGYENATFELSTAQVGAQVVATAESFAAQATAAGVNVKSRVRDPTTYFAADYHKFPFFVSVSNGSYPYLRLVETFMLPDAVYNESNWANKQWLGLYNQAVRTTDEQKRLDIQHQMQQIEYDEGGYLLWGWNNLLSALSKRFSGLDDSNQTGQAFQSYDWAKIYQV